MNIIQISGDVNFFTADCNDRRFFPVKVMDTHAQVDEAIINAAKQLPDGASAVQLADAAGLKRTAEDLRYIAKRATAVGLKKVRVNTPVPRFVWKKA